MVMINNRRQLSGESPPELTVFWLPVTGFYAKHHSRSHDAVVRVFDAAGNVIETHEHAGEFKG
jgi:hypothetical protein